MAMNARQIAALVSLTAVSVVFAGAALAKDQPVNPDDYKPGTLMADDTIVIAAEKINNGRNLSVIFATRKDAAAPDGTALIMDFGRATDYCKKLDIGGQTGWRVPLDEYEAGGLQGLMNGPLKDGFLIKDYKPEHDEYDTWSTRYWTQVAEREDRVLQRGVMDVTTGEFLVGNSHLQKKHEDGGESYVARTRCTLVKTFKIEPVKR